MPSPFLGLSLILHLMIRAIQGIHSFLEKIASSLPGISVGKSSILVRNRDERVLPLVTAGVVICAVFVLAFFPIRTAFQSRPNTIDGVLLVAGEVSSLEPVIAEKFINGQVYILSSVENMTTNVSEAAVYDNLSAL